MIRYAILAVALIGCILGSAPFDRAEAASPKKQQVFKALRDSVVRLKLVGTKFNGEREVFVGTGFVIDPQGFALTSDHFLPRRFDNYRTVELTASFSVESKLSATTFEVVARDSKIDLALIKLQSAPTGCCYPVLLGTPSGVEVGDEVYYLGYPAGLENISLTSGLIGSLYGVNGWWQLGSLMNPGNSGGPVFDERGLCVGIAAAGLGEVEIAGRKVNTIGINFVIPVQVAVAALLSTLAIPVHDTFPDNVQFAALNPGEIFRKSIEIKQLNMAMWPGTDIPATASKGGIEIFTVDRSIGGNIIFDMFGKKAQTEIIASAQGGHDALREISGTAQTQALQTVRRRVEADEGFRIQNVKITSSRPDRIITDSVVLSANDTIADIVYRRPAAGTLGAEINESIVVEQITR